MNDLFLYEVDFKPVWSVPSGLIILARNEKQAWEIAEKTIKHTEPRSVTEIKTDKPKVIFYESGDY